MLGRYLSNIGIDITDCNFAGCQDSMKFTSGYIYLLVGCVVSWKTAK